MIVDALGNLIRFVLLPGQRHDITSFDALMAGIHCLALIGDKGFDAGWLRERLRANDMVDGKVTGGVGVSGATGDQDEQCAKAGLGIK